MSTVIVEITAGCIDAVYVPHDVTQLIKVDWDLLADGECPLCQEEMDNVDEEWVCRNCGTVAQIEEYLNTERAKLMEAS